MVTGLVSRREFLQGTAALGGGLLQPGSPGAAGSAVAGERESAESFTLQETTIGGLQERMTAGELTARSAVQLYLERTARLNRTGPELRAIIETNPDALDLADRLDRERHEQGARGPLHGIPVLLKDTMGTDDRMSTTAGSLALEGAKPRADAFIVKRLRAAGAIVLGKANMSEWNYSRGLRVSSGWSARGGQCRNPYVLDRSPSGSSSGSAVAVAANLTAVALGSDTGGSIVGPASANGIVGLRPTVGLVSRNGLIPWSKFRDTAGPMARTVRDTAVLLGVLAGEDEEDIATHASRGHAHNDYTQFLRDDGLRDMRIGVVRQLEGFRHATVQVFDRAVRDLHAAGAVIVDPVALPIMDRLGEISAPLKRLGYHELRSGIDEYLRVLVPGSAIKSLADVIAFNSAHRETELRLFGQENFIAAQEQAPLTAHEYAAGVSSIQNRVRHDIDAALKQHRLDLIVAPATDPAWPIDHIYGDRMDCGYSMSASILAGYPSISVPMGAVAELPVGLLFFGPAWSEPVLLRAAHAYEQTTHRRTIPGFKPTVEVIA